MWVICWKDGSKWELVSGEDALQKRVDELELTKEDIVVGEVIASETTESQGYDQRNPA